MLFATVLAVYCRNAESTLSIVASRYGNSRRFKGIAL